MSRKAAILHANGTLQLQLDNVEPAEGAPTSGWVLNGRWFWRRVGTAEYCLRGRNDPLEHAVAVFERPVLIWLGYRHKPTPVADDVPF